MSQERSTFHPAVVYSPARKIAPRAILIRILYPDRSYSGKERSEA
jgi:hypothetical protein